MLWLHLSLTLFLSGLIWVIQLVHYPLFDRVEREGFAAFEAEHSRRISWIVVPAMLTEGVTGGWLLWEALQSGSRTAMLLLAINAVLLLGIWSSTAWLQVPAHRRLGRGFDAGAHRRLVRTNWFRTAAWSARSLLLVLAMAARAL